MDTTFGRVGNRGTSPSEGGTPLVIPLSLFWNLVVALGSGALAYHLLFVLDDLPRLGDPVRYFLGLVAATPMVLALISDVLLLRKQGGGRYIALVLYFVGMVLSLALLLDQWGFYQSFEYITDGVIENAPITLGFAVAYALYWLSGRFIEDDNPLRGRLDNVAGIIAAVTLLVLLIASDVLGGFESLLSTYSDPLTWVLTGLTVVFALLFGFMLRLGRYFGETPEQLVSWQGWLMLSPNIVGFAIFFAGPLLLSLYLSFTDAQLGSSAQGQGPNFIAFDNYADLLALEIESVPIEYDDGGERLLVYDQDITSELYDPLTGFDIGDTRYVIGAKSALFWTAMRNTLLFCLLLLPLAIVPALTLSLILNSKLPGMKFFRAVYFLPSVAAVVGSALIWQWLYGSGGTGYINYAIGEFVGFINGILGTGIAEPDIRWLNDPNVVLISVVILAAWQVVGYNTVLFLAGLQGVPKTLYEAAMIDGANKWQQFRNVTMPMLAPTTFFVVITTMVTGLQAFNEPYALFPNQTVPEQATTAVYHMYRRAFFGSQFGEASAIAWLLFIFIFGITLLQFRFQRSEAY